MAAFDELSGIAPLRIWDGVAARAVEGERVTLAVVELDAGSVIPEHAHENEQVGLMLAGSMAFRISGETREVLAGSTWSIPPNVPHEVSVGPEGAVVVEAFVPARADWGGLEQEKPLAPRWP